MNKKLLSFLIIGFFALGQAFAQCPNTATLAGGSLTPPGVGLSTSASYGAGQYVLAFVAAGANYTVTTCGSSSFDTQLTVYDDATGTYYAYNDDNCGLQSAASFTATRCGNVRVILNQYSCNASGLIATVTMTRNNAGTALPSITASPDVYTCPGAPVVIGTAGNVSGGSTPYTYAWTPAAALNDPALVQPTATVSTTTPFALNVTDANNCMVKDTVVVNTYPVPVVNLGPDVVQCGGSVLLNAGNTGSTYMWSDGSTAQTLSVSATGTYYVNVTNINGCQKADTVNVTIHPLPVVNLGADTTQCGGTVLLDAGNAGATYLWNDSTTAQTLTVSATGTYSVTVTTAFACQSSDAIMVTINTIPTVNLGPDTTQCGGTILLDAGNAGSTYMWNDSTTAQTLTASATGDYSVIVTNTFGCHNTDTIHVTINGLPVVNLGPDTTQCSGTVVLDAGNAGLSYLWNDSTTAQTLTVSMTGTYNVTVTSPFTGCAAADTIHVTIDTPPVVNLGADTTQCGGTIILDAGNSGMSYMWSDMSTAQTLTVDTTGLYYVTVTNGSCAVSDSINVTINALPVVTLAPFSGTTCENYPAFALTNGSPAGGSYTGTGVTFAQFDPAAAGPGTFVITYMYTDANACASSDTASIMVDVCTGIAAANNQQQVNIYPNPATEAFNIEYTNADFQQLTISIIDIRGKVIYAVSDKNISADYRRNISTEGFAKGIYYIKLDTGKTISMNKLIVQ